MPLHQPVEAFDDVPFRRLTGIYDAVERLLPGQSMGKVVVDL